MINGRMRSTGQQKYGCAIFVYTEEGRHRQETGKRQRLKRSARTGS